MNNILSFKKVFFLTISEIYTNKKSERTFETPCIICHTFQLNIKRNYAGQGCQSAASSLKSYMRKPN